MGGDTTAAAPPTPPTTEQTAGAGAAEAAPEPPLSSDKKHPLEHSWTLWFDNPNGRQKQSTWGQTLRSVHTFSTVEDFWCLYNNIVSPSRLIQGTDFHLFKEGVEPKWEDPKCARGGKWTFQLPKEKNKSALDTYWLHLLLAMIGEQFDEPSEICGAVVSVRAKGDKISLWTKTAGAKDIQVKLGRQLKSFLDLGESVKVGYMAHDDAIKMDRKATERYTL